MTQASFDLACDRLSHGVDKVQHEYLRWSRNEGPMLDNLVALANSALASRPEFELAEEGATNAVRRFILKVHGIRIAAITIALEGRRVVIGFEELERGKFSLLAGEPISSDYEAVDESWMIGALEQVFDRVQP